MEPLVIDLRKVDESAVEELLDKLPSLVKDIDDGRGIRAARRASRAGRAVTVADARAWHRCLMDVIAQLRSGGPLVTLRTPTECCAFTTIVEHALDDGDGDSEYLLDFVDAIADGRLLPDCVAPLCAWADFDEYRPGSYGIELDAVVEVCEAHLPDGGEGAARPAIRHPLRTWRVTVTLEIEIDRSGHDCDPDVCPLEVTARKRVTFKSVAARTKTQAEQLALDLFERTHKVSMNGSYGAESRLLLEVPPVIAVDERGHHRVHRWYCMISGRQGDWSCVCGSSHEDGK